VGRKGNSCTSQQQTCAHGIWIESFGTVDLYVDNQQSTNI